MVGIHLPINHPIQLALYGAYCPIEVDELAFVAVAHYRPCRAGGPAATNPDHAAKARLVLKHQPYPTTTYVLRLYEGRQCFGEFFSTPLAPAGRSLGALVFGATLRQSWIANIRYTTEAATGRPNFCASATRIGATTNIPPVVDACSQGSKKRRSSSGVSDSLRRPPWVGRSRAFTTNEAAKLAGRD